MKIEVEVKTTVREIVLNSHLLSLSSARIVGGSQASNISYDEKAQRATLNFPEEVPPSPKTILEIAYKGTINNSKAIPVKLCRSALFDSVSHFCAL